MTTLREKTAHYNSLVKSPFLNKSFEPVKAFRTVKAYEAAIADLFEAAANSKGKFDLTNDELPQITIPQPPTPAKPSKTDKPKTTRKKKAEAEITGANNAADTGEDNADDSAADTNEAVIDITLPETEKELSSGAELIRTTVLAAGLEGKEWYQNGQFIMDNRGRFGNTAKENREVAFSILDTCADESGAVPVKGINNKGDEIVLRKKNGSVKWAAWERTRKMTQNLADIFAAVEKAGWEAVFPEGNLVKRPEVIELKKDEKTPEAPIQTIRRSLEMVTKKAANLSTKKDKDALKTLLAEFNSEILEFLK